MISEMTTNTNANNDTGPNIHRFNINMSRGISTLLCVEVIRMLIYTGANNNTGTYTYKLYQHMNRADNSIGINICINASMHNNS